ncbi:DUF2894 domain-containing protein [Seongchinamella sediminis]|uniref:DUF2894 domain-containing protein n=1 Tax=Seongchinamella sediminis TaxID=2283635 RepID=UPI0013C357FC|nr:DUF2894 domain-containing protein [Seongchinamella sediminis]
MTELRAELKALKTAGDSADPVQLRYIESLLLRAEQRTGRLGRVLEDRARKALAAYRRQLPGRRARSAPRTDSNRPLRELNRLLAEQQRNEDDPRAAPLEAALRQQELELAHDFARQANPGRPQSPAQREELKAARRFHSAMVRFNADKVVRQALAEVPEDAGPLNPQRLATRSLETMRDLSPHYLSRFVSYIDTLFWLERADRGDKR